MPETTQSDSPPRNTQAYEDYLRQGAAQEFPPTSAYRRLLNDELVDAFVCRNHAQSLHTGFLNAEIRGDWDKVSAGHPGAKPAVRHIYAWKGAMRRPGARAGWDIIQRATYVGLRTFKAAARLREFDDRDL